MEVGCVDVGGQVERGGLGDITRIGGEELEGLISRGGWEVENVCDREIAKGEDCFRAGEAKGGIAENIIRAGGERDVSADGAAATAEDGTAGYGDGGGAEGAGDEERAGVHGGGSGVGAVAGETERAGAVFHDGGGAVLVLGDGAIDGGV